MKDNTTLLKEIADLVSLDKTEESEEIVSTLEETIEKLEMKNTIVFEKS